MQSYKMNYPSPDALSLNALASCASLFTALYRVFRLFVSMLSTYEVDVAFSGRIDLDPSADLRRAPIPLVSCSFIHLPHNPEYFFPPKETLLLPILLPLLPLPVVASWSMIAIKQMASFDHQAHNCQTTLSIPTLHS